MPIVEQGTKNTEEYLKQLDAEAEQLIKDAYHQQENKNDSKGDEEIGNEDKDSDLGKEDEGYKEDEGNVDAKNTEEASEENTKDENNADSKDDTENEDINDLRERLVKAQKQVKDNKAQFTKRSQELSEANKRAEHLEQVVFDLKNQIEDLQIKRNEDPSSIGKKEDNQDVADINETLKGIEAIDPDIAKVLAPVIKNLTSKIENLQSDTKTYKEMASKNTQELALDAHFGKLDSAVPGWEDTLYSEEFSNYINDLSSRQKKLALADLKSGSAEDIIEIFKDFESVSGTEKSKNDNGNNKNEKLEKARTIANPKFNKSKDFKTTPSTFLFTRSEISAMSPEEYAEKEKEIDKALAKGLISNE